jgi:hypothetical protein
VRRSSSQSPSSALSAVVAVSVFRAQARGRWGQRHQDVVVGAGAAKGGPGSRGI